MTTVVTPPITTIAAPTFTDSVDLRYFLEPLHASSDPRTYLDRFPDELYDKSLDSHFIRFMYAILGPAGIGWFQQNLAEARLLVEAFGINLFSLDNFYGNPFAFGRIVTEQFNDDVTGLLPDGVWETIQAQDASYRSRAIQFLNAARLGTAPQGMALAASSGLGQPVEVVENYQYLFDIHSDDPLGLPHYGQGLTTGEFAIVPQPAISKSVQQIIHFDQAAAPLGSNSFTLAYNGASTTLPATALAPDVQVALSTMTLPGGAFPNIPVIGIGNVRVTGGPAPNSFVVRFAGALSNQTNLPTIEATFTTGLFLPSSSVFPGPGLFPGGSPTLIDIPVKVVIGAVDPNDENVLISDIDKHTMEVAIDYLRPTASYPTFFEARSKHHRHRIKSVKGSSGGHCARHFVTGDPQATWAPVDKTHWIEASKEKQARITEKGCPHHYIAWHNVSAISAYTDHAFVDPEYPTHTRILKNYVSEHIGRFPEMRKVMPWFDTFGAGDPGYNHIFKARHALSPTISLRATGHTHDQTLIIDHSYPADYLASSGKPTQTSPHHERDFWSSLERRSGGEVLEIDFGIPRAINYISMQVTDKPVFIQVDYDALDQAPRRRFVQVIPKANFTYLDELFYRSGKQNPWQVVNLHFHDGKGLIYTRFMRITFTRVGVGVPGAFLWNEQAHTQTPWSVDVRNLRIGRNVAPTLT